MLQDRSDLFLLAYDSPSFSAAASKVPMSPQGFTKAIHNLERDLGVPLFALGDDGMRHPTPYADEFYEYAKHLQAERNLLETAFARIAKSGYVELRVAAALGVAGLLGLDLLHSFGNDHKDVSVSINELSDSLCETAVRDGLYDLAFTVFPVSNDFETLRLYESPVLYWVNRSDPLSELDSLQLSDIAQRKIFIPGREFHCYRSLIDGLNAAGIEVPEIIECPEIFWIYEQVLHGGGVGFSLPHLAHLEVFAGNEEVVALPLEGFTWSFGVSYLKTRSLCRREEDFIEFVVQRAKRLKV